ncbi:MAG: hypothetical protein ACREJ5_27650 [Geminicoccaceae bacterium]
MWSATAEPTGQEYALADTAFVGVPLDQQEGDEVRVVCNDASGPREVVEITKVE